MKTEGYTLAARYTYREWVSLGGNFSHLDVRDNVKTLNAGSEQANLTYKDRIPNLSGGQVGAKRFLFGPCTARFSFQEKEKWGV